MTWMHPLRNAGEARIRLIAREAELAARLATAETDLALARAEIMELRKKMERLLDNALFASGFGPVFAPEDARFRPRPVEEQVGLTRLRQPTSAARWRQRAEQEMIELARDEEKKRWQQDLARIKQEAGKQLASEQGPAAS